MSRSLIAIVFAAALVACGSAGEGTEDLGAGEDQIVGGRTETRWAASGYLVSGAADDALDVKRPTCGATLIAPNVIVTAAHCATAEAAPSLAFGTGNVGSSAVVRVIERHAHPDFHARPQGMIDIPYALRKHDLAYLVLERSIPSVTPAVISDVKPVVGCNVQAIGYHALDADKPLAKVSMPACVQINLTLVNDPIIEVRPDGASGLCSTDGDEGSPIVLRDSATPVLVGIYVGSVTQFLTDCRKRGQYLNGYESAYGYREFLAEGIARGAQLARRQSHA